MVEKWYFIRHSQSQQWHRLLRFFQRESIIPYVEDEIVGRYYYQRGRTQHLLLSDKVYERAVQLLNDLNAYYQILKP